MNKPVCGINSNKLPSFKDNLLLAALPEACLATLAPHLLPISVKRGESLSGYLNRAQYLYFPTTTMISLVSDLEDGHSSEVAVIGKEGLVGSSLLMGGDYSYCNAVVQTNGGAYLIKTHAIQREFDKNTDLQRLLLLFTQALIFQISLTAACNRHHSIGQQCCRWLLLSLERSSTNDLRMTQSQIANNLGVRRESVTEVARILVDENIIQCSRGLISVLDWQRLETRACECYLSVKNEYDRLLPTKVHKIKAGYLRH